MQLWLPMIPLQKKKKKKKKNRTIMVQPTNSQELFSKRAGLWQTWASTHPQALLTTSADAFVTVWHSTKEDIVM